MIGNNETISLFKGTDEMSKLLLKRMKLTGNWVWKEKVQDNRENSKIVEREVDENIIKRMKVLILNAAQAPKCSVDQKDVLFTDCWDIPDTSLLDYRGDIRLYQFKFLVWKFFSSVEFKFRRC